MAVVMSDASADDWACVGVRVLSIALVPAAGGSPVTVWSAPTPAPYVNLEQLDQLGEILGNVSVPVGDYVIDYIVRLVRATRPKDPTAPDFVKKMVDYGAGPRACLFLRDAGRAFAAMDGRFSVAIDDVKKAAIAVLRHRISTNFQAQAEGKKSEDIIRQLLAIIGDPDVAKYEKRKK